MLAPCRPLPARGVSLLSNTIDTLLAESRSFSPNPHFARSANVRDSQLWEQAERDHVGFWEKCAEELDWIDKWRTALEGNGPNAKWFVGGKLNACHNCVDRHVSSGLAGKTAIIWEGEPGDLRTISYAELRDAVCQAANALVSLGVSAGDRVCIYMPMVPELPIAMLACARIGAAHSVVFGGFSAESLAERVNDAGAKLIITADGGWRRGGIVPLKRTTDQALSLGCPTVQNVLVLRRIGEPRGGVPDYDPGIWKNGRDVWWHELVPAQSRHCPCEPMDSEALLYILYTSGSTGKPKGIVHTTGGYLTGVNATSRWVFDLKPDDVYWCTADCGWVTGHSYVVYGPLSNGATVLMYEGAPDTPDRDRFWQIVERHKVTVLYTAPTAIRAFMKWGVEYPERCDLSSLRLLGSVGEPINPEAWIWYQRHIGLGRCPVVDTWWQTETGQIMISPLPGVTATKPGSATRPLPGIGAAIYSEDGRDLSADWQPGQEIGGYLVLTRPWPAMTRGIYGDQERFLQTYWSRFPGAYFTGDGAKLDGDGYFWLLGRVDDIMLVAGHNISTMEVESALVDHHAVAEAAVIGRAHELKGQGIAAFVIIRAEHAREAADEQSSARLIDELKAHVAKKIGPIARPDDVFLAAELPKTRSGKIMRRLLRDVAEGRALGDVTTLADPAVVAALKIQYENAEG